MEHDLNHQAVLNKVNTSDLDETRKMVYRRLLIKTNESTNGRTTNEKIQDITETLAAIAQIFISREIDDDKISKTINDVCKTIKDIRTEVLELKSNISKLQEIDVNTTAKINSMKKEVEKQIKEEEKTKTITDKIIDFLKNMPWSFTVLGLGICGVLVFHPELAEILKWMIK